MLVIALIVLVAMTLAGLGMMRSVDTASIIAGNIGFKQSTLSGADSALQSAVTALQGIVVAAPNDDNPGNGYFAHVEKPDPDWSQSSTWTGKSFLINNGNRDDAGNRLSYRIERLCDCSGVSPGGTCPGSTATNFCASSKVNASGSGVSNTGGASYSYIDKTHYRITVLAEGPRNARTVVQTVLRF